MIRCPLWFRRWLVPLVALICAVGIWPRARVGAQAPAAHDARAWLDAVETHVPGRRDAAVDSIATWDQRQLAAALSDAGREVPAAMLERALILHTDIAISHRLSTGYDLPGTAAVDVMFADGQAVGQVGRTFHWEMGRRIVALIPERPERTRVARLFYRATAARLQLWGENPELTAHLTEGLKQVSDDPILLLYAGTLHQHEASPRVQRFLDARRALVVPDLNARRSIPSQAPVSIDSSRTVEAAQEQAIDLFRLALSVDPDLQEARIRLANVLGDRGDHAGARAELRRATSSPLPRLLDYYASLLVGREEHALGHVDPARVAFEHATTLYPRAQAALFGLSQMAMDDGDAATALAELRRGGPRSPTERIDEPWWRIGRVHEPSADTLLGDMVRGLTR
jgi:hypothetical protein